MAWNYLSIPKLQRCNKLFHTTLYWACHHLSMLGLKLNHISKRSHRSRFLLSWQKHGAVVRVLSLVTDRVISHVVRLHLQTVTRSFTGQYKVCLLKWCAISSAILIIVKHTQNHTIPRSVKELFTCVSNTVSRCPGQCSSRINIYQI